MTIRTTKTAGSSYLDRLAGKRPGNSLRARLLNLEDDNRRLRAEVFRLKKAKDEDKPLKGLALIEKMKTLHGPERMAFYKKHKTEIDRLYC